MTLLSETRERFVRAILAQVPADRIAEVHFFQPIKQGGVETGVAVVAAWPEPDPALEEEATAELEAHVVSDEPSGDDASSEREPRPIVYTARYRLTLKGPDRGKWETNVVEEAEAPLVTVEAVVRGVQRRAGDAEDPVRMSGEELRAALPEPQHPAA
ncbi:MAG TPA: hypothetical protein VHB25_09655 [Gemmatimonadaceae bacterium]|nr:hypothetical protein [Gemmatimonadaceae bacterium]